MALVERQAPFLQALTPQSAEELMRLGTERSFASQQYLLRERERDNHVLVLLDGWAAVSTVTERGAARLLLALRRPGELIGEMAMVDGAPRSATVTALGQVRALIVAGDSFRRFLSGSPQANVLVMAQLTARLRNADAERRSLVSLTVLQRLSARLLEFAEQPVGSDRVFRPTGRDGADVVLVDLAQHDLADAVGATREAVAKALRPLRAAGVVHTRHRRIELSDMTVLRLLAAGGNITGNGTGRES
ncbi:Crp/Fnr family transcriptional regulator [Streptomyces sp. SPB162]|uniref:Crp/Fnr family transcriptional regulator n=1 Tax=Streptomyces sp. SPB162 TaxID=2940560 RepID=UPI0024054273|nr:Crp/Fnr family transcriptional regulator [Streptomyces sp. SPB162]MDF9817069.1 CRP/FNR family cyclic AMP-dependent transcriptional regulator [Streptomyces sp. SPB162]